MDKDRVKKLVRELIIEVGEDPTREGLRETPERIANMLEDMILTLNYQSNSLKIQMWLLHVIFNFTQCVSIICYLSLGKSTLHIPQMGEFLEYQNW